MYQVKNAFVHCSATPWGEVLVLDQWHKLRGWSSVGYHEIILNGRPFPDVMYWDFLDGQVQPGRHLDSDPMFTADEIGAHVAGRNPDSIGICLIGRDTFTDKQLIAARALLLRLTEHFGLGVKDVLGHYEDPNTHKTCPNIPCSALRDFLEYSITLETLQACIADQAKVNWENLAAKNEADWYAEWLASHDNICEESP